MAKVLNMYQLKPIIDSSVIVSESKCMYKMKNIHESINHVHSSPVLDISDKNQQIILPEMAELEERQKKILEQLELLKNQMNNLRSELKLTPNKCETNNATAQVKFANTSNLETISLKIHPNNIPYYLLDIQKLWHGFIDLVFTVHTHSTVKNLLNANKNFEKQLTTKSNGNSKLPQLHVTVIWKEVQCVAELVVSPLHAPIIGETNILRYLARIENSQKLIYEGNHCNILQTLNIDHILDICYRLNHPQCKSKTEKQKLLRLVTTKLGKSQWLAGTESLSIADIALHAVIQQLNLSRELNVKLSNWLNRYQELNKRTC